MIIAIGDYLHVMDLADGHVAALGYAVGATTGDNCRSGSGRLSTFDLGTGTGYSVLDMVDAFGRAVGRPIPVVVGPRRPDMGMSGGMLLTTLARLREARAQASSSANANDLRTSSGVLGGGEAIITDRHHVSTTNAAATITTRSEDSGRLSIVAIQRRRRRRPRHRLQHVWHGEETLHLQP